MSSETKNGLNSQTDGLQSLFSWLGFCLLAAGPLYLV